MNNNVNIIKNNEGFGKKIKTFCVRYRKEILFEMCMIIIVAIILYMLNISIVSIIDGSLIAIILAIPVSIYNWMSNQREKFFYDNLELLVNISKEDSYNEEMIDLRLTQINYIYENKIKSAGEEKLEGTIRSTISKLILNDLKLKSDIDEVFIHKIYKRLGMLAESNEVNDSSKFTVIDDFFVNKNNHPMEINIGGENLKFYIGYDSEGDDGKTIMDSNFYIAKSNCNIEIDNILDIKNRFNIFDSTILPVNYDNAESLIEGLNKESEGNEGEKDYFIKFLREWQDKNKNELKGAFGKLLEANTKTEDYVSAEIKWEDNLFIENRKTIRDKMEADFPNSYVKFSRNYADQESERNIRAGWFSMPEGTYTDIVGKYENFYFIINGNSEKITANQYSDIKPSCGVILRFDKENLKKYIEAKEGDIFATSEDKEGNKTYQFYLRYGEDENYAKDTRVADGGFLKIKRIEPQEYQ